MMPGVEFPNLAGCRFLYVNLIGVIPKVHRTDLVDSGFDAKYLCSNASGVVART
jgi:hypothetical protein